jgi:hypothetical protein
MNRKNSAIPVEKVFKNTKALSSLLIIPNDIRLREMSASNSQQDILAFEC